MKTLPVTRADLAGSVLAVPPLARNADFSLNEAANQNIVRYLESGGVTTLLYGGNANFYNIGVSDYAALIDMLERLAAVGSWLIPSIGPSFGVALDQARLLRGRRFPAAMVLPMAAQVTPDGVASGLSRLADELGAPLIAYVRREDYLAPSALAALVADGRVVAVKYAVERAVPLPDRYLASLIDAVGTGCIVSGMGELPAIAHLREPGLAGFTSGSVCVAPRMSTAMLHACQRGDFAEATRLRALFVPLEDLRNGLSPIRVLHEAVRLTQIADTGPLLPMLSNIEATHHMAIATAARTLREADQQRAVAA